MIIVLVFFSRLGDKILTDSSKFFLLISDYSGRHNDLYFTYVGVHLYSHFVLSVTFATLFFCSRPRIWP